MPFPLTLPSIGNTNWGADVNGNWTTVNNAFQSLAPFTGKVTINPTAEFSGIQTALTVTGAANTGLTASTEVNDALFALNRTVQWATGALSTQRAMLITAPTYAFVGASTITNAATLAIAGAPVAGTNATISNPYALWVQAGAARFDDGVFLGAIGSTFKGNTVAGVQDGSAAVSGQVGEIVESVVSTATNAAASGTYLALASITLTPGDWQISALAIQEPNVGGIFGAVEALIGTTTASNAGTTIGYDRIVTDTATGPSLSKSFPLAIPAKNVLISVSTTYYLNVLDTWSTTAPQWRGSITARRMR